MLKNLVYIVYKYVSEPRCDIFSIQATGKFLQSSAKNYDNVYGSYQFKYWDAEGHAVYEGDIDGKNLFVYKGKRDSDNNENWLVSIFIMFCRKYTVTGIAFEIK